MKGQACWNTSSITHFRKKTPESCVLMWCEITGLQKWWGYFSLKAGLISLNERQVESTDAEMGEKKKVTVFDTLPGVELANFAVNSTYVHNHEELKGLGVVIFNQFILLIVRQTSDSVGFKILYIFALPYEDLIKSYHDRYGFSRLGNPYEDELHKRLKPFYDRWCKFMYLIL